MSARKRSIATTVDVLNRPEVKRGAPVMVRPFLILPDAVRKHCYGLFRFGFHFIGNPLPKVKSIRQHSAHKA